MLKPKTPIWGRAATLLPSLPNIHPSPQGLPAASHTDSEEQEFFQLTCQEEQCIIFQHLSNLKAIRFQRSAWHVKLSVSAEELCEPGFIQDAEAERPKVRGRCCICGRGGENHTAKVLKPLLGTLLCYYKSMSVLSLAEPQFGVPRPDSQGRENSNC